MKAMIKKFLLLAAMVGAGSSIHGKAIHTAVRKGDLKKIEKILKRHPEKVNQSAGALSFGADLILIGVPGGTPMRFAVAYNQFEAAKLLLSKGADPNLLNPLHFAIRLRKPNFAIILLEAGASLKTKSTRSWSPKSPLDVVEYLLNGTYGDKSLFNREILRAMVEYSKGKIFNQLVLKWVFRIRNARRRFEAFKILIQDDVRKKFAENTTLLHLTAASGVIQIAQYLIENGAADDLKAKTTGNQMPIHFAKDPGMRAYLENAMIKRNIPVE